jgi:hypothetical protein
MATNTPTTANPSEAEAKVTSEVTPPAKVPAAKVPAAEAAKTPKISFSKTPPKSEAPAALSSRTKAEMERGKKAISR